ncbi:pyruvate kinase [Alphaproteobacteria bacterium]|nr:pyruvate kinase [Alphaproteobacteria bacterium]
MNSYKETKKHFRATKILATLGSASNDMDQISSLVEAGVNIFRMNFSHGIHEEHLLRIQMVREIEKARSIPIGILADMQGPKYRVGEVAEGTSLVEGASIQFDQTNKIGNSERLPLPHSEIFKALYPGARVLMDDGKLELIVKSLTDTTFVAEVKTGGAVSSRKGVNLPDIKLDTDALTEKDLIDLEFALNNGADWIALSFVQSVSDVLEAKVKIAGRAQLMAKIEKPAALDEIEDIINAADAIMIARGDLGVELDAAEVPAVQKKIDLSMQESW